ncbi:MAG: geranylgeranylglycerol-phosphate geranylgeranyltransferase [Cyclobacteriaceae bacterium]|nr:geranylgeranylglycerol-phosphate geranylgeranyltransferase [Cyclobacteriaceae bacterium]
MRLGFLQSLFRLTRFWNLLIIGLTQYCTAGFLISPDTIFDIRLFLLATSTILIAAAGYIINDYYDVKIDLVNKPGRVVIGKELSRRSAILLHSALSIMGVEMGVLLDWKIGLLNFASAFLLWVYSNALKRMPFIGNVTVAFLTGLSVLIVNVLYPPLFSLVWVYALFAFFITLVREIIKDIEDLKGDTTFGCRTLPIVWGILGTKQFIFLLLAAFVITVWLIHLFVAPLPILFFCGFLFLPLGILLVWLIRADTVRDFYLLSQFCKVIMLAGIVSMAVL